MQLNQGHQFDLRGGTSDLECAAFQFKSNPAKDDDMKFLITALAAWTLAVNGAFADDAKVTKPQQFADLATVASMFEMQSSELAVKQAKDDHEGIRKAYDRGSFDDGRLMGRRGSELDPSNAQCSRASSLPHKNQTLVWSRTWHKSDAS